MLNYRLAGTTEASASYRNWTPPILTPQPPAHHARQCRHIFAHPGAHRRCAAMLNWAFVVRSEGFEPPTF